MWPNPQETVNLVTFTEGVLSRKFHFCAVRGWGKSRWQNAAVFYEKRVYKKLSTRSSEEKEIFLTAKGSVCFTFPGISIFFCWFSKYRNQILNEHFSRDYYKFDMPKVTFENYYPLHHFKKNFNKETRNYTFCLLFYEKGLQGNSSLI